MPFILLDANDSVLPHTPAMRAGGGGGGSWHAREAEGHIPGGGPHVRESEGGPGSPRETGPRQWPANRRWSTRHPLAIDGTISPGSSPPPLGISAQRTAVGAPDGRGGVPDVLGQSNRTNLGLR